MPGLLPTQLFWLYCWAFSLIPLRHRSPIEATILRAPGMLYQEPEPGKISNLYNIKLVNKTNQDLPVDLRLLSHQGEIKIIGKRY